MIIADTTRGQSKILVDWHPSLQAPGSTTVVLRSAQPDHVFFQFDLNDDLAHKFASSGELAYQALVLMLQHHPAQDAFRAVMAVFQHSVEDGTISEDVAAVIQSRLDSALAELA